MKPPHAKRGITAVEVCVLVVLVTIFLGLLIPSIRAALDNYGSPIPTHEPDEVRREYHQNGMSIVVPVDWWHTPSRFAFCGGGRYCSTLHAECLADDFDDTEFTDRWDFNGATVPSRRSYVDNGGGPKGHHFGFEFIVSDADVRYCVGYESREDISELPAIVARYLQTFRTPSHNGGVGEQSDAPKDRASRFGNGKPTPGPR